MISTPFEKRLLALLHAAYGKKADDLVNGSVPLERYKEHLAYLIALKDVFAIIEQARKEDR